MKGFLCSQDEELTPSTALACFIKLGSQGQLPLVPCKHSHRGWYRCHGIQRISFKRSVDLLIIVEEPSGSTQRLRTAEMMVRMKDEDLRTQRPGSRVGAKS